MCCKNTDLTGYFKGFTTKIVYNPAVRIVLEGSFRPSGPDRYTKRYTKKPPTGGFSGCRTVLLRHAQRLRRHNHTVVIGVDKLARHKHHTTEFHRHIHITDVALVGFQRVGTQRLHTQVSFHNDVHIADAAIHNDAFPTVFGGFLGQHVAQQCMTHRATTVDNHDLTFAVGIDQFFHFGIVFKTFHGHDFATERITAAKVAEHRLYDLNQLRVGITQIWRYILGHSNLLLDCLSEKTCKPMG